jgi:hypothetical protein
MYYDSAAALLVFRAFSAKRFFYDVPRARGLTLGFNLPALRACDRPTGHQTPNTDHQSPITKHQSRFWLLAAKVRHRSRRLLPPMPDSGNLLRVGNII